MTATYMAAVLAWAACLAALVWIVARGARRALQSGSGIIFRERDPARVRSLPVWATGRFGAVACLIVFGAVLSLPTIYDQLYGPMSPNQPAELPRPQGATQQPLLDLRSPSSYFENVMVFNPTLVGTLLLASLTSLMVVFVWRQSRERAALQEALANFNASAASAVKSLGLVTIDDLNAALAKAQHAARSTDRGSTHDDDELVAELMKSLRSSEERRAAEVDDREHADSLSSIKKALIEADSGSQAAFDKLGRIVGSRLSALSQGNRTAVVAGYVQAALKNDWEKSALDHLASTVTPQVRNGQLEFERGWYINQLGRLNAGMGDFAAALDLSAQAAQDAPDEISYIYNFAYCLDRLGRHDDAARAVAAYLEVSARTGVDLDSDHRALAAKIVIDAGHGDDLLALLKSKSAKHS